MVSLDFDATQVEPTSDFEPIPAGKYVAVITDSEVKDTKSGRGSYLQLAFQITEGEYKNRFLWARLNLENPNQTAVKIARAELLEDGARRPLQFRQSDAGVVVSLPAIPPSTIDSVIRLEKE